MKFAKLSLLAVSVVLLVTTSYLWAQEAAFVRRLPLITRNIPVNVTPTPTPRPGEIVFTGATNQGLPVEVRLTSDLARVTYFSVTVRLLCAGEIYHDVSADLPPELFENGHLQQVHYVLINDALTPIAQYVGQLSDDSQSFSGTWKRWDPDNYYLCNEEGIWTASR